jgi:DEAD/DEAH box helicase domain-containing protein
MDANEFFCPKCKRIKSRCICGKKRIKDRNMELLRDLSREEYEFLVPFFDTDDEVVDFRVIPSINPEPNVELDEIRISSTIKSSLREKGINKLYEFQKLAIESLLSGKNVVVTAPTGFGKTEAFVVPMIEMLRKEGKGIVMYPTKALARDQELKIKFYCGKSGLKAVRFDGDSTRKERDLVFSGECDVVLTNPDMVDYHLRNPDFQKFLSETIFVAVDELHYYTGFLGANLYYIFRRMSGFSDFQISCSSATISNAKEFCEVIFEKEFEWINAFHRKGSGYIVMLYTSNPYNTVPYILKKICNENRKILIFGNSYKSVEHLAYSLRSNGVRAYIHKAGLRKDVRRKVEEDFREGRVNVVVSTSTLELGVDIGDVDVVVSELVSFPQFVQRIGRAGRKGQRSVGVVLLREDDSISNYYRLNPSEFYDSENFGYVEKENEDVARYHLISMVLEGSLKTEALTSFEGRVLEDCMAKGLLKAVEDKGSVRMYLTRKGYDLLRKFNIRGAGEPIRMYLDGKFVGERNLPMALKEMHPGAILIHNGEKLRCIELDMRRRKATLERYYGSESTQPLYVSIPVVKEVIDSIDSPLKSIFCELEITMVVHGFVEKSVEVRGRREVYLDEPLTWEFTTKGFLFSAPFPEPLDYENYFAGSFHALEHILIEASNGITGGGSSQMGGISTPEGDIFIYDACSGGNGLSRLLHKRMEKALRISLDVLRNCRCRRIDGCPGCTYSYQCGNNNKPLNRIGAIKIIEKILEGDSRKIDLGKFREPSDFAFFP